MSEEAEASETGSEEAANEGASSAETAEAAHTDGGWMQNLRSRVLSGVPAVAVALLVIGLAPTFLLGLIVAAGATVALIEFYTLLPEQVRDRVRVEPYAAIGAGMCLLGVLFGASGLHAGLAFGAAAVAFLVWLPEQEVSSDGLTAGGVAVLGLLMGPWLLFHTALIHGLEGGGGLLTLLVVVIALNDTAAYLVGSLFGTRPLAPAISPRKTVEGSLAGIGAGVLGGFLVWLWLLSFATGPGFFEALLLGAVLAGIGQVGDLLESKLKRLVGANESGSFLPGHGGLLDRLDAYLLAAPALYYYGVLTGAAG